MTSEDLFQRARRTIPGGVNSPVRAFRSVGGTPFFTESAQGAILTTADDRNLIDFVCTWGPAIHGHNDPDIREAVADALSKGTSFGTPGPLEVDMAEAVVERVPSVEKVRMCNSGTEATMSSIRLARGFTGRDKIVKFIGCYHGHVDSLLVQAGSGALTLGKPDSAGVPASFAAETILCPYNDFAAISEIFEQYGEQIAAVIVEPYPANCGLILPKEGYLPHLREVTQQHGSLLIFDEVMTGFRLAMGGVQEREGITPDLSAFGKVIGGGLPVGAFGGRAEIMDYLAPDGPVYQAGTLSGNPLAMAAGLAALKKLNTEVFEGLETAGLMIAEALRAEAAQLGIPLCINQAGSMFALFFGREKVESFADVQASETEKFSKFFHAAMDEGVYLPPSAYETCFLSTAHDQEILDRAISSLTAALRRVA
ncbi:glutamate-1-semialdehyde 2,1-aminomutase [Puniceicoccus vermicola]|uniref:Glutamate-1-semialdehyde 2,1-aminomutase n=1 Tax=Puniceicoccus vermicola TaxID=388746 RepID=A0A7X1E6D6_9BACT|nr:glutamate-1-semialdehyde 2,1-aminomutase [Puniceicoccus vermicola]MBC2604129.1 glutamate-1-semialdehyde 2,1-aminomutase [Puniceicoccus vermicola]